MHSRDLLLSPAPQLLTRRMGLAQDRPNTIDKMPYVYNHLRFVIKFHKDTAFTGARIVGFEVEPLSVKHQYRGEFSTDMDKLNLLTGNRKERRHPIKAVDCSIDARLLPATRPAQCPSGRTCRRSQSCRRAGTRSS